MLVVLLVVLGFGGAEEVGGGGGMSDVGAGAGGYIYRWLVTWRALIFRSARCCRE